MMLNIYLAILSAFAPAASTTAGGLDHGGILVRPARNVVFRYSIPWMAGGRLRVVETDEGLRFVKDTDESFVVSLRDLTSKEAKTLKAAGRNELSNAEIKYSEIKRQEFGGKPTITEIQIASDKFQIAITLKNVKDFVENVRTDELALEIAGTLAFLDAETPSPAAATLLIQDYLRREKLHMHDLDFANLNITATKSHWRVHLPTSGLTKVTSVEFTISKSDFAVARAD